MSKLSSKSSMAVVLGAAFALTGLAAQASVFQATDLGAGYMVADAGEGKCGEGKCGEGKKEGEAKCGEGKCGEGKKEGEAKCGEGKCGESK
ncbi:hypothetical protein [Panacagrimonas sp.]|uniref:HvfA family oxazolone/thioamide-modified RiPP metallophore n=1 Tax=Panacagrimonas sp. TaxID=2480088 RepID=UPI003B52D1B1